MKKKEISFQGEDLTPYLPYCTVKKNCIICGSTSFKRWANHGPFKTVRCNKCDFIWMRPFLNRAGLEKYYKEHLSTRRLNNDAKMKQRTAQYQEDKAFIHRYVETGNVLDVGCSGGFFLNELSSKFKKHGIEIDADAVAYAKKNFSFGKNIHCIPLEDVPYPNNSFDLVVMRGVIEHLPDPVEAVRKVSELVKKGGFFYITATPNGASFAFNVFREKWNLFHPTQHIWHFSPRTLEILCKKFGLRLVALDFPYLGTPYENAEEDVLTIAKAIHAIRKGKRTSLKTGPPFWENMMSIVFQKI